VNYNSRGKWDIVGSSLRCILSIDYRPLEIIIVDNGSTDGSFEMIKQLLSNVKFDADLNVKIIRLSKNYGFAVANVIAYRFRDPNSKYIALINNDACPERDSLKKLVNYLETLGGKVAGLQGIILSWDGRYVLSYGGFTLDHGLLKGGIGAFMESNIATQLKPVIATYIDGAYSLYRVEALEKVGGLFLPYFFMWGDDYELGVRLWRAGYILLALPIVVARHYSGATTSIKSSLHDVQTMSYIYEYWYRVGNVAVDILYNYPWHLFALMRKIISLLSYALVKRSKAVLRGVIDGIRLGIKLRKKILQTMPWLKNCREPTIRTRALHETAFLIWLSLKYGFKHSGRLYYILIARSLGRKCLNLETKGRRICSLIH
jgi:GT2 family glycosyltransferase